MSSISSDWQDITGPNTFAHLAVAASIAYSGTFNTRRLECHLYGLHNMFLQRLVANLGPSVVIQPQLEIDLLQILHDNSISVDDSIATLYAANATKSIPDFTVLVAFTKYRPDNSRITSNTLFDHYLSWTELRLKRAKAGVLMEIKRAPTRSAKNPEEFLNDLETWQVVNNVTAGECPSSTIDSPSSKQC